MITPVTLARNTSSLQEIFNSVEQTDYIHENNADAIAHKTPGEILGKEKPIRARCV